MSLPPDVRREVALRLLESVEDGDDTAVEAAWTEEITSRIDDLRNGRVQTIPHDEVLSRLAQRRAEREAARQW